LVVIAILSYMIAQPGSPFTSVGARRNLTPALGMEWNIAPGWGIPPKENISNFF